MTATAPMTGCRRRLLRASAWACLASALVLGAAWALSGWCQLVIELSPNLSVNLSAGCVEARRLDPAMAAARSRVSFSRVKLYTHWDAARYRFDSLHAVIPPSPTYPTAGWDVLVPVWWAPPLLLAVGGVLWWASRRRPGCPTCGYDLAGLAKATPCPECGTSTGARA